MNVTRRVPLVLRDLKTVTRDVYVTVRVRGNPLSFQGPPVAMSGTRLEPIILITSSPSSSDQKNKRKGLVSSSSETSLVGSSRKKIRTWRITSPDLKPGFEVLLPPLGSWKNRLLKYSDNVRIYLCLL